MTMLEGIGLICSVVALGAGGLVWVVASMMAPLKEAAKGDREKFELLIENNTQAMLDIKTMVREQDALLADHHVRLSKIETVHEMRKCHDLGGGD